MPPQILFKLTVAAALLWAHCPVISAQSAAPDLHQFDARIAQFLDKGLSDSALYFLEQKSQLAQRADSLALWAQTQVDIHEVFEEDHPRALDFLNQVWDRRWRDPKDAAEWRPFMLVHANRGWFLKEMGRILPSIQAYEQASKIFEQYRYPDFDAVRFFYKAYGNNYVRLGDNDKAIAVFQKAIAANRDHEEMSGLYCNIGIAYWNKGDYAAAEENYRKGLSLPDISAGKRGFLLGRLAETMLDLGRTADAAKIASEALHLLRPEGPDDWRTIEFRARARRVAGLANTQLGKFAQAERLLAGALSDDRASAGLVTREVGKDYIAISTLHLKRSRPELALQAADQALAAVLPSFKPISQYPNIPISQSNPSPSQFYEENTLFEALTAKAAAAQGLFEKSSDARWLEWALDCHELAWQAEAILRKVFQYSSSKLHLQKDARSREEAAMDVARMLFEKTGQNSWLESAFTIAERSKAAILLEAMQDNLVRQRLSGGDPRFDELTVLRQSLSFFDKNLLLHPDSDKVPQWRIEADNIQGKIADLEQALRKEYPSLTGLETKATNWLPAPGDFDAGEALVEYFVSKHWVDVFVFRENNAPVWKRIPNDANLQSLTRRYLDFFSNDYAILNDPAGYLQTAHALWNTLLPAEAAAAPILTILPDGILNFVPFEALVTGMEGPATLRNAAYLLRRQEVRYAWSLAVLRRQKNLKSKAPNYLLSIAPGFANRERGLAPLSPADFDWLGIEGWDNKKLSGQTAGFQNFMKAASGYRVLHFATHAFAGDHPRIELADSSLLLPDLYALPLRADLVMLSACQTGLGREEKGEGVMSLARAFAQAGAACIVSSLWSVNDQSTARLLRFFYENIRQGHTSGAALREAKLAYLSDPEVGNAAQSPYFWAGLVVVGDDRAIEQPWSWGMWGVLVAAVVLVFLGWGFWGRNGGQRKTAI